MPERIFKDNIKKAVISNPRNSSTEYRKISVKRTDDNLFHIEKFTKTQVFQENIPADSICDRVCRFLDDGFACLDAWSDEWQYALKISKKGKRTLIKNKNNEALKDFSHNRAKNYIINENDIVPPLVDLGIFTKDGKVVNSMYDKFKQINRFTELVDDCIKSGNFQKMNIADFGCGKSYLTFILYHYLVNIKGIDAHITGLDLKKDVIKKCSELAVKYGYKNLHFEMGDINGFSFSEPVDMVITLHACDTATDFALYNAIRENCKIILSVPCCQHELAHQLQTDNLGIISRYGIIKERFSSLATDAIRGNLLTACGYSVQLLEFIDMAHSPKNILIRAVKNNIPTKNRKKALAEVEQLIKEFNFDPTLYRLLSEDKNELF